MIGRVAKPVLAVAALFWAATATADEFGDAAIGQKLFSQCRACHQIGDGASHRIGPQLNGVFGRTAGSQDGFRYSPWLQRAGINGLDWHAETLDAFLADPRALASGTRMRFSGMEKAEDRLNVIAYLRQFSDSPADIPEADPTASPGSAGRDRAVVAMNGDPEYGEYLSAECTTCHRTDGADNGIPSIVTWPQDDFVRAMHAYKTKKRPHPVMQMMAGRLTAEEIAALAAYFATLTP